MTGNRASGSGDRRFRWQLFLIFLAVAVLFSETMGLSGWLLVLRNFVLEEGKISYMLFIVLYAVTSLAMVPGTGMTLIAGFLFPPAAAIAASSVGGLAAAACAFWIARRFASKRVENWLHGNAKYERYNSYIRRHETTVLILSRLMPFFPHVVLNYTFGLSRIPFWSYSFWTWLCMLPGTAMYVLIAHGIGSSLLSGHILFAFLLSLGLAAMLVCLAW